MKKFQDSILALSRVHFVLYCSLFFFLILLSMSSLWFMYGIMMKNVTLDTQSPQIDGAKVVNLSPADVDDSNGYWDIWVNNEEHDWGLWLYADDTWGFDQSIPSQFSITFHGESTSDSDMLISFTDGGDHTYFSMITRLDGTATNQIAPGCDSDLQNPSINLMNGDVYSLMYNDDWLINLGISRRCRPAYIDADETCAYETIGPPGDDDSWPITFSIRTYPSTNRTIFGFNGNEYNLTECAFIGTFPLDSGISVYITTINRNHNYRIHNISLQYQLITTSEPTSIPTTPIPSTNPTTSTPTTAKPTTASPTLIATADPTAPTISPTTPSPTVPTFSPTTLQPTAPTIHPTTGTPTSGSPTNSPSILSPTKDPTPAPSHFPTVPTVALPTVAPADIDTTALLTAATSEILETSETTKSAEYVSTTNSSVHNAMERNANSEFGMTSILQIAVVSLLLFVLVCCIGICVCKWRRYKILYKEHEKYLGPIPVHQQSPLDEPTDPPELGQPRLSVMCSFNDMRIQLAKPVVNVHDDELDDISNDPGLAIKGSLRPEGGVMTGAPAQQVWDDSSSDDEEENDDHHDDQDVLKDGDLETTLMNIGGLGAELSGGLSAGHVLNERNGGKRHKREDTPNGLPKPPPRHSKSMSSVLEAMAQAQPPPVRRSQFERIQEHMEEEEQVLDEENEVDVPLIVEEGNDCVLRKEEVDADHKSGSGKKHSAQPSDGSESFVIDGDDDDETEQ